ncbi:MAG TPA: hypothetical protein VGM44_09525, partial [Polyangiaceae bacterium]
MSRRRLPIEQTWIIAWYVVAKPSERSTFSPMIERANTHVAQPIAHRQQMKATHIGERRNYDNIAARIEAHDPLHQADRRPQFERDL